jgi:hypothetical protein
MLGRQNSLSFEAKEVLPLSGISLLENSLPVNEFSGVQLSPDAYRTHHVRTGAEFKCNMH